jgi:hypothetical protein
MQVHPAIINHWLCFAPVNFKDGAVSRTKLDPEKRSITGFNMTAIEFCVDRQHIN